jgi:hypothetical protein
MGIHRKEGKIHGIRMRDLRFNDDVARCCDDIILMVFDGNECSTRRLVKANAVFVCGFENFKARHFTRLLRGGENVRGYGCTRFYHLYFLD